MKTITFNSNDDIRHVFIKIDILAGYLKTKNTHTPPIPLVLTKVSKNIRYNVNSVKDIIEIFKDTDMDRLYNIVDNIIVQLLCFHINSVYSINFLINNVGGFGVFEKRINNIKPEKLAEYFKMNRFSSFNPDNFEKLISIENFRNNIKQPDIIEIILLNYKHVASWNTKYFSKYWDVIKTQCNYIINDVYMHVDLSLSLEQWELLYSVATDNGYDIYPVFRISNYFDYDHDVNELFERCKFYLKLMDQSVIDKYFINYMKKTPNAVVKKLSNCDELINNTTYIEKVICINEQAEDLKGTRDTQIRQLKNRLAFYKELEDPESSKETLLKYSYNAGMIMEAKRIFEDIVGIGITNDDETFEGIVEEDDKGSLLVVITGLINRLK